MSVLSPIDPKQAGSYADSTTILQPGGGELLTAKAPMPLSSAHAQQQDDKSKPPELPPYGLVQQAPPPTQMQPTPPPPTTTKSRSRSRGKSSRANAQQQQQQQQAQQQQQQVDLQQQQQHQAFMSNLPPYTGYPPGFPGQQMPPGIPGMQGFPNPMMQGGNMMPNLNQGQFAPGQFPPGPGGQFPPMG